MRPSPEKITLGDKEWTVRPLTLRQVQDIELILTPNEPRPRGNVAAAIEIVGIALRRDHAEDAASLADIESTAPEIAAAMSVVLRLGGFLLGASVGEDRAAPAAATTGDSSTAG